MCYACLLACVCNCMCECVLKKVSPSSQDFFCRFVLYQFSRTRIPSQTLTSSAEFSFRVRILLFWAKNVEFIDIGNIGFTRSVALSAGRIAACGFCILMAWRGHGGKKAAVKSQKGFAGLKSKLSSVLWCVFFGSCPVLKSCRNGSSGKSRRYHSIINLRRVQDTSEGTHFFPAFSSSFVKLRLTNTAEGGSRAQNLHICGINNREGNR